MEQVEEVIMVSDTPPAPKRAKAKKPENSTLAKKKQTLDLAPGSFVVDHIYPRDTAEQSLRSVKSAAYQVNVGERRAWPSDTYYGIWGEVKDRPGVYQLLIGKRSHLKDEWAEVVNRAGSRKSKKADAEDDAYTVSPFDSEDSDSVDE